MNGYKRFLIFVVSGLIGYLLFGYLGLFLVILGWGLEA